MKNVFELNLVFIWFYFELWDLLVVEEIVDYEEWMVDDKNPDGIVIDMDSNILKSHPEVH